ncbi:MAG: hypothetical protein ACREEK_29650 [Bradyrhizobium sp.]
MQDRTAEFVELDTPEKAVKIVRADDQRYAGSYCLITQTAESIMTRLRSIDA